MDDDPWRYDNPFAHDNASSNIQTTRSDPWATPSLSPPVADDGGFESAGWNTNAHVAHVPKPEWSSPVQAASWEPPDEWSTTTTTISSPPSLDTESSSGFGLKPAVSTPNETAFIPIADNAWSVPPSSKPIPLSSPSPSTPPLPTSSTPPSPGSPVSDLPNDYSSPQASTPQLTTYEMEIPRQPSPDGFGTFETGTPMEIPPEKPDSAWPSSFQSPPDLDTEEGWGSTWGTSAPLSEPSHVHQAREEDEWEVANEQRLRRDKAVPPGVLSGWIERAEQSVNELWPSPEAPAESSWRGGLDNVEGIPSLETLLQQYQDFRANPPSAYTSTVIYKSFATALRITRHMPVTRSSPLSILQTSSGSSAWEENVQNHTRHTRVGSGIDMSDWMPTSGAETTGGTPKPISATPTTETKLAPTPTGRLASFWSRRSSSITTPPSAISPNRASISTNTASASPSNSTRASLDIPSSPPASRPSTPLKASLPLPNAVSILEPQGASSVLVTSNDESTDTTAAAPGAVSRFLGRFSRNKPSAETSSNPNRPVSLSASDISFLGDIVPTQKQSALYGSSGTDLDDFESAFGGTTKATSSSASTPLPPALAPPPKSEPSRRTSMLGYAFQRASSMAGGYSHGGDLLQGDDDDDEDEDDDLPLALGRSKSAAVAETVPIANIEPPRLTSSIMAPIQPQVRQPYIPPMAAAPSRTSSISSLGKSGGKAQSPVQRSFTPRMVSLGGLVDVPSQSPTTSIFSSSTSSRPATPTLPMIPTLLPPPTRSGTPLLPPPSRPPTSKLISPPPSQPKSSAVEDLFGDFIDSPGSEATFSSTSSSASMGGAIVSPSLHTSTPSSFNSYRITSPPPNTNPANPTHIDSLMPPSPLSGTTPTQSSLFGSFMNASDLSTIPNHTQSSTRQQNIPPLAPPPSMSAPSHPPYIKSPPLLPPPRSSTPSTTRAKGADLSFDFLNGGSARASRADSIPGINTNPAAGGWDFELNGSSPAMAPVGVVPAVPTPSSHKVNSSGGGGLSAQDLSFFEGL